MIIDSKFKPWLVASKDKIRRAINGVYFDKEKSQLVATDGLVMGMFPVRDCEEDTHGAVIPVEAIREAAKAKIAGVVVVSARDGVARLPDGRTWPLLSTSYPSYERVLPRFAETRRRTARISLNPALLNAIYAAVGADDEGAVLEFELDDEDDAREGRSVDVQIGQYRAVIMPIRLTSRAPERFDDVEESHEAALAEMLARVEAVEIAHAVALAEMGAVAQEVR